MAKLEKKWSKSENSFNFDATKIGSKFLTPNIRMTFNHLYLVFTKTPILWHFDLKYHIWIEINILGYAIGGVLN